VDADPRAEDTDQVAVRRHGGVPPVGEIAAAALEDRMATNDRGGAEPWRGRLRGSLPVTTGSPIPAPLAFLGDPDVTLLFNSWPAVLRVVIVAAFGYLTLLVLLRISGQRTLSQLTSFDLIITITIGSAFGRVITARDVALVEVLAAFGTLVLLQVLVAWLWERLPRVRAAVTPTPALLYHDGQVVEREMRKAHLREADLLAAVRRNGMGSLDEVRAIVFEGDGSLAVLSEAAFGDGRAVDDAEELQRRT
jgi:uncharacterized membrane protein YcaP (DUF421 family)